MQHFRRPLQRSALYLRTFIFTYFVKSFGIVDTSVWRHLPW